MKKNHIKYKPLSSFDTVTVNTIFAGVLVINTNAHLCPETGGETFFLRRFTFFLG